VCVVDRPIGTKTSTHTYTLSFSLFLHRSNGVPRVCGFPCRLGLRIDRGALYCNVNTTQRAYTNTHTLFLFLVLPWVVPAVLFADTAGQRTAHSLRSFRLYSAAASSFTINKTNIFVHKQGPATYASVHYFLVSIFHVISLSHPPGFLFSQQQHYGQ
jgi:hypothetical protein